MFILFIIQIKIFHTVVLDENIAMFYKYMISQIALVFGSLVAIGTLKPRLFSTLVSLMSPQVFLTAIRSVAGIALVRGDLTSAIVRIPTSSLEAVNGVALIHYAQSIIIGRVKIA